MSTTVYVRTLNPWLVRDEKVLAAAVVNSRESVDVYGLARELEREPVSILRRLRASERSEKLDRDLERQGLWVGMDEGTEEEGEFWGLALSGAPLAMAWRWCVDETDQGDYAGVSARPTLGAVEASMTSADLRPAMALVRESGLMFGCADQIDSLRFLVTQPLAAVVQARQGVESRFDVPTPKLVAQGVFGVFPGLADAAVFDGVRLDFKKSSARGSKSAKATKAKRSRKTSAAPRKAAGTSPTKAATKTRSAYKRKRKSSSSKKSSGSSGAWWAKYKKAATSAATKTGYSGRGRGRSSPIIPEEEYEISDGPRIIEYI